MPWRKINPLRHDAVHSDVTVGGDDGSDEVRDGVELLGDDQLVNVKVGQPVEAGAVPARNIVVEVKKFLDVYGTFVNVGAII